MKALERLELDLNAFGIELNADDWQAIGKHAAQVSVPAGHKIQNQVKVADAWVFLSGGIAASEQTWSDGSTTIARFFEPGHICANFTSVWTRDIASDDLIAVTDITGLALPDSFFRLEYLQGGQFGTYLRLKMAEAHLFAKELICAKTSGRTETRYQFLNQYHGESIANLPKKDIARFLGITPQGFSRFLRNRKSDAG
ncbi:MAG: hypothetical protein AAFO97_15375 [Pseudomonadota bacterium]